MMQDSAVLQFQNQKLAQKLEVQQMEIHDLDSKLCMLKNRQSSFDNTIKIVRIIWEKLVGDLESNAIQMRNLVTDWNNCATITSIVDEEASSPMKIDNGFNKIVEGCSEEKTYIFLNEMLEDVKISLKGNKNIISYLIDSICDFWKLSDKIKNNVIQAAFREGSSGMQNLSNDLYSELQNLRLAFGDLHWKNKTLVGEMWRLDAADARNKSEIHNLNDELENIKSDLEETKQNVEIFKSNRDDIMDVLPVLHLGGKPNTSSKSNDKHKGRQEMDTELRELLKQASLLLLELKELQENRIQTLKQVYDLQGTSKSIVCVSSSPTYLVAKERLKKSKEDVFNQQGSFAKLQAHKHILVWREKEMNVKNELLEAYGSSYSLAESRIKELQLELGRNKDQVAFFSAKLAEASTEAGRKDVISNFKALVSSFPESMRSLQVQLNDYKTAASDINSLHALVLSLSNVISRKESDMENLSSKSAEYEIEIKRLKAVVHDLMECQFELKLILKMLRRESTDSREISEAKEAEYNAWAHVQSLKSSLDERILEQRVKTAIEAEALTQQELAAAEAEIADLRQKLKASKRDTSRLSDVVKSKHEENGAFIFEIETIGQACDDMQSQNMHLLQQVTERDDYNIKLILEGVSARQQKDGFILEKEVMDKEIENVNSSIQLYDLKYTKIEDQLKAATDHFKKLSEEKTQKSVNFENTQKKLADLRKVAQQTQEAMEEMQLKIDENRATFASLQIELENERFNKKRIEEEIEIARGKASRLVSQADEPCVADKLRNELNEYREILNCSVCHDRPKEVVITKCYHMFCNSCTQTVIESRHHRRCPICAAIFGPNDVKPVYI